MGRDGGSVEGRSAAVNIPVNDKYIVLKRYTKTGEPTCRRVTDYDAWTIESGSEVLDAVVIRLQDVFAQAALWTYASEIRAALEILVLMGIDSNEFPQIERLHEIADYFATMAEVAGGVEKRKVPD